MGVVCLAMIVGIRNGRQRNFIGFFRFGESSAQVPHKVMRLQDSCQSSSYQAKCSWTLDDPVVAWSAQLFRGVTGKANNWPGVTQL